MHSILSALLAIHAVSAGALAKSALIDGRSAGVGTIGQDADLTISMWTSPGCASTYEPNVTINMSWGLMQSITVPIQYFALSRVLGETERLDWSAAAPDTPGAKRALSERVIPACAHYIKSTSQNPYGSPLQREECVSLGLMVNVSYLFRERAKCAERRFVSSV